MQYILLNPQFSFDHASKAMHIVTSSCQLALLAHAVAAELPFSKSRPHYAL